MIASIFTRAIEASQTNAAVIAIPVESADAARALAALVQIGSVGRGNLTVDQSACQSTSFEATQ